MLRQGKYFRVPPTTMSIPRITRILPRFQTLRHSQAFSYKPNINSSMSTYNPEDKKYPQDVMEKFLKKLAKFGKGDITLEKDENLGVATVTIDNPKRKNALTGYMMVELKSIVCELESWKNGKAVILRGQGDTFCSGGDLNVVMKEIGNPEDGRMMCEYMQEMLTRFMELPLISVAALNGRALGGGAEVRLF